MAAYGSLLSLMNLIENIQFYHAHHPKFLDKHQKQLESLHNKVTSLKSLLEWCSSNGRNGASDLESLIVDAANGAEDIIELYIAGDISWKINTRMSTQYNIYTDIRHVDDISLSGELHKVIENMNIMENEITKIKEKSKGKDQQVPYLLPCASVDYPPGVNDDGMVGLKEEFNEIMNKINAYESNLEIISITGMGGCGKSTLARHVLDKKSIPNQFDVCGWVIFTQEFRARQRLSQLLKEFQVPHSNTDEYHLLGEKLHKHLWGRRFLIVADDIWSVEDWDKFKLYLPDNGNKSRIILTTRLLNVATGVGSSHICNVNFLDEETSWRLLCRKAFFNHTCPSGLQDIGKKIARNCKGLPLSLTVIGGLLSKSEKTREHWEKIAREINMIVSSEDDERCLKILSLSYNHLPIHLKPCFLYMGMFPEGHGVPFESLIDLWIAEGFVRPCGGSKGLEEIAQKYLEDLIQRSLLYVTQSYTEDLTEGTFSFPAKRGNLGMIRIHDLLKNLALKEAQKEKFLNVTKLCDPNLAVGINSERRIGLHGAAEVRYENSTILAQLIRDYLLRLEPDHKHECDYITYARKDKHFISWCDTQFLPVNNCPEFESALSTTTFLRSLICDSNMYLSASPSLRLLRISSNLNIRYSPEAIFQAVNSRNLQICRFGDSELSPVHFLWNLQVLVVSRFEGVPMIPKLDRPATFQIWEMPFLRKLVMHNFVLPDPPTNRKCDLVSNLQTISYILDLRCTVEVLRKISNIQILHLMYADECENGVAHYCLDNLDCLHNLQMLGIWFNDKMDWPDRTDLLQNIGLSQSLKILSLQQCGFEWDLLTTKVGSLPHLEELKLNNCYTGEEWIAEEGFFLSLKILRLTACCNLVRWSAESDHFPCLEQLFLQEMESLEEIPFEIGETPTLESIHLIMCSSSIVSSAKMILQEQLRYGNDGFRVLVSDKKFQEEQEVEVEENQEEEEVQQHEKRKKSRGFLAFAVPFLVILGSSFGLLRSKFGGRARSDANQKKDNDRRRKEGFDSWWMFYEYP